MSKPLSPEQRLEWETRIRKQMESGLSVDRWCRENQIRPHAFYYWKERLFPKSLSRSHFSEILRPKTTGISLECRGVVLRVDPHFDPATLRRCLSILMDPRC
jgi:hypothetical protein